MPAAWELCSAVLSVVFPMVLRGVFASYGDDDNCRSYSTTLIQLKLKQEKRPIGVDTWWTIYSGYGDVTLQPLVGFFFIAIGCFSLILQKSC